MSMLPSKRRESYPALTTLVTCAFGTTALATSLLWIHIQLPHRPCPGYSSATALEAVVFHLAYLETLKCDLSYGLTIPQKASAANPSPGPFSRLYAYQQNHTAP